MQTILIPVDFGPLAYPSVYFGFDLARRLGAQLLLFHVVAPAPPIPAGVMPLLDEPIRGSLLFDQMQTAMAECAATVQQYRRQQGYLDVPFETDVRVGPVVDTILHEAETAICAGIIMGTTGATTRWQRCIGSVTSGVAQRVSRPLWIIPGPVSLQPIHSIAYFADLRGNEFSCIHRLLNLSSLLHARLEVVHVSPPDEAALTVSEAFIQAFEQAMPADRLTFQHLAYDSVPGCLEAYVQRHQPDMLVLAHQDRTFLDTIFHKSLVRHVSLTARRLVLIIPKGPLVHHARA